MHGHNYSGDAILSIVYASVSANARVGHLNGERTHPEPSASRVRSGKITTCHFLLKVHSM